MRFKKVTPLVFGLFVGCMQPYVTFYYTDGGKIQCYNDGSQLEIVKTGNGKNVYCWRLPIKSTGYLIEGGMNFDRVVAKRKAFERLDNILFYYDSNQKYLLDDLFVVDMDGSLVKVIEKNEYEELKIKGMFRKMKGSI